MFGVDIGGFCYNIAKASIKGSGAKNENITDGVSNRNPRTCVSFFHHKRIPYVFELNRTELKNTAINGKDMLGLKYSNCNKILDLYNPYHVKRTVNDDPYFLVNYREDEMKMGMKDLYELYIYTIYTTLKGHYKKMPDQEWTLSIPGYYNDNQKAILRSLCNVNNDLMKLKCRDIISESVAFALGFYHESLKLKKDEMHVMILADIGYIGMTVSIVRYERDKIEILCEENDYSHLGGRNIDILLCEYLKKKILKEHKELKDKIDSSDSYSKILNVVIDCKEKLSTYEKIEFKILKLGGEVDYEGCLTNDEIIKVLKDSDIEKRMKKLLDQCLKKAELNECYVQPDEMILRGGTSKIPYIQNILNDYLSKKLNNEKKAIVLETGDGLLSRGCIYYTYIQNHKLRYMIIVDKINDGPKKDPIVEEANAPPPVPGNKDSNNAAAVNKGKDALAITKLRERLNLLLNETRSITAFLVGHCDERTTYPLISDLYEEISNLYYFTQNADNIDTLKDNIRYEREIDDTEKYRNEIDVQLTGMNNEINKINDKTLIKPLTEYVENSKKYLFSDKDEVRSIPKLKIFYDKVLNDYNTFKEIAKERIVVVCDDISKHQKKMKGKCNLQEIEKIRKTVLGSKVDKTTLDEYYNDYSNVLFKRQTITSNEWNSLITILNEWINFLQNVEKEDIYKPILNEFDVGKYLKILNKFDSEMKSMTIQDITIPYVIDVSTKIGQLVIEIFDSCVAAILSYLVIINNDYMAYQDIDNENIKTIVVIKPELEEITKKKNGELINIETMNEINDLYLELSNSYNSNLQSIIKEGNKMINEILGDLDEMQNKPDDINKLNDYVIKKFPQKEIVYNSPTPVTECTNYYIDLKYQYDLSLNSANIQFSDNYNTIHGLIDGYKIPIKKPFLLQIEQKKKTYKKISDAYKMIEEIKTIEKEFYVKMQEQLVKNLKLVIEIGSTAVYKCQMFDISFFEKHLLTLEDIEHYKSENINKIFEDICDKALEIKPIIRRNMENLSKALDVNNTEIRNTINEYSKLTALPDKQQLLSSLKSFYDKFLEYKEKGLLQPGFVESPH